MFKERRKSERHTFNRYARIQVEMSGASRDCLIINMSEDGVRLHSEIAEIPGEFTLVIADAEHPRRSCRVVWRLGFEIGAKFTDLDRLPVRRPAAAMAGA
jgi:PilZ domain